MKHPKKGAKLRAAIVCIAIFGGFSQKAYALDYEIKITPCQIGTSCKSCEEVIPMKFAVDVKANKISVTSKSIKGEPIKEQLNTCHINDDLNWTCKFTAILIESKRGKISILNIKDSSLYRSNKEMCLIN